MGITVPQECVRNEYFEWKIDTKNFGEKEGCLFIKMVAKHHTRREVVIRFYGVR